MAHRRAYATASPPDVRLRLLPRRSAHLSTWAVPLVVAALSGGGKGTVSKLGWQRYGRCVDTQSQNQER